MRKQYNRCVYVHIRLDTGKVFYVGMGTIKRAYESYKRNIHWKRIINKTNFLVKIVSENLTWEEACKLEINTILKFKSNNLCNMTDGGDGSKGLSPSEETREKIRMFHKDKPKSKESKEKMSKAKQNKYLLSNNPNAKKVINTETDKIFNTLKEAADSISKNYSSFKWSIKHAKNFNFKYI